MKSPIMKILVGLLYVAFIGALYFYIIPTKPETHRETIPNIELARSYERVLTHAKDEDIVLVEMILSLVQNYYVDTNQFNFEKLILATLKSLKNHGTLSFELDRNNIQISKGVLSKDIPRQWFEDELGRVASILKIAQFLDDIRKVNKHNSAVIETIGAVISSLDPYSKLLSEEEYRELKEGTEGEFGGLGIMVGVRNDLLTVIKLLPHSPADRAGVHPLDHILAVNGQTTFGASLEELIKVMRGSPGTPATLSFLRDNGKSPFDISMKRELVQIDPVTIQHLKTPNSNEALLLKLDTFSVKSYDRLRREIERSIASRNAQADGIIIDLRSNPGGLLEQAVKISKILLSEGSIVTVKGRETETEYADHENLNLNVPVVVLIDEDSASASEILAGALKDHDRAIIVGQPSYGKGTVQTVFELPAGRALKLTIARYLTPSGTSIQGVGVVPDIWLHPIFKQDLNENLMGHYRYRLDRPFIGFSTAKQSHLSKSKFMNGYYLKELEPDAKKSKEVDLALNIFDEYKKSGGPANNKNFRSSFFLSKVRKQIESKIGYWDSEVSAYLKAKQINWFEKPEVLKENSIHITEKAIVLPEKVFPGTHIGISFSLKNDSNTGIARSSVFVRATHREMDTVEKLIGYLQAQRTLKDRLDFEIPNYWLPGQVQFQIGIAVNGIEIENTTQDFSIDVSSRKEPVLVVTFKTSKILRAGENVDLVVNVRNDSDEDVHIDKLKILNLSGRQLSLKEKEKQTFREVKAHDQIDFGFNVAGAKEIFSNDLTLGFSLESRDLKNPLYKLIHITAVPTVVSKRLSEFEK